MHTNYQKVLKIFSTFVKHCRRISIQRTQLSLRQECMFTSFVLVANFTSDMIHNGLRGSLPPVYGKAIPYKKNILDCQFAEDPSIYIQFILETSMIDLVHQPSFCHSVKPPVNRESICSLAMHEKPMLVLILKLLVAATSA